MVLNPGNKQFEIKGFSKSIHSVLHKKISVVGQNKQVFVEDPIRLFRLVKIVLNYPEFEMDDSLRVILRKTLRTDIWMDFLKNTHQRGRLATQFEMLFVKFGMESVIQTSYELGILNSITGLNWQQIMPSLRLLLCLEGTDQYLNRLNFYQFIYINYCIQVPLEAHSPVLAKWVRCVRPMHQLHFDYIEQQLLNKEKECYVNHPTLNEMIQHIQAVYQPSDSKSLSL